MKKIETDVCIIGAGFSGLAAAHKLQQAGKSSVILEARNRVGGRVYSHTLPDGTLINRGGTWIGCGHERLHALAKELGIITYRQYVQGDNLMIVNGKHYRYSGTFPRMNPFVLADFGLAIKKLDRLSKQVPLTVPWEALQARRWDSQTLAGWLNSRFHVATSTAKKMLHAVFTEIFMSDPSEISFLHALHFIHSMGNLEWVITAVGGAQQDLVVGGMQSIADHLAQKLGPNAIFYENPAQYIQQEKDSMTITARSITVKSHQLIIAIPPILAARLQFEPALPALKMQLLDRSVAGQGIKWHAIYPEPFWRADGMTGQGADMDEVPETCIECTPHSGSPGILAGFAFGPSARKLAAVSKEERQRIFLNGLIKRFGPKAAKPIFVDEYDWSSDPWAHGDMFAHYPPGVLTGFGKALREPCGRIHWAGTETATHWGGSIEGAVRSGERAAEEVLHASR